MTERTRRYLSRPWSGETWDGPAVIDATRRIALIHKNPERGFFLANRIVAAINAMEDVTTFPGNRAREPAMTGADHGDCVPGLRCCDEDARTGLLTTADAMTLIGKMDEFYAQAHGGRVELGFHCAGCAPLWTALCEWVAAHAAGPDELEELEVAKDSEGSDGR